MPGAENNLKIETYYGGQLVKLERVKDIQFIDDNDLLQFDVMEVQLTEYPDDEYDDYYDENQENPVQGYEILLRNRKDGSSNYHLNVLSKQSLTPGLKYSINVRVILMGGVRGPWNKKPYIYTRPAEALVIAGGAGWENSDGVSTVTVKSLSTSCSSTLPSLDNTIWGASMEMVGNQLVHCGGWNGTTDISSCRVFHMGDSSWRILPNSFPRAGNVEIALANRGIAVLGGFCGRVCGAEAGTTDMTYLIVPGESGTRPGTPLTSPRTGLCAVTDTERNRIIITGGNPNHWSVADSPILNNVEAIGMDLKGSWTSLPSMNQPHAGHACGISMINGHKHLVVTGYKDTEVLQLDNPSANWRVLPGSTNLNHQMRPTAVTVNGQLHVIGGLTDKNFAAAGNRFVERLNEETWELLPLTLPSWKEQRSSASAVVPEDWCA